MKCKGLNRNWGFVREQRFGIFLGCVLALYGASSSESYGAETVVCDNTTLRAAVNAADPGDRILLCSGTWRDLQLEVTVAGERSAPITIAAEIPGRTRLTGNVRIELGGRYIVIDGLIFTGTYTGNATEIIRFKAGSRDCSDCRITNVVFDGFNSNDLNLRFAWITVQGTGHRVDHSYFANRLGTGRMVKLIRRSNVRNNARFDHNYFGERPTDGGTALAIGTSGKYAASDSGTLVEYNYFYDLHGSHETIVNKSSGNHYRGNTIEASSGGLTLRQGNNVVVEGNYVLGRNVPTSAGVKVGGRGHTIVNNYFADLDPNRDYGAAGVGIRKGDDHIDPTIGWIGRPAVHDLTIAFNTLVNSGDSIAIGIGDGGISPTGLKIANNIFYEPNGPVIRLDVPLPADTWLSSNLYSGGQLGDVSGAGFQEIDPSLTLDQAGIYRPTRVGPTIGLAAAVYGLDISLDIDQQERQIPFDIGADERDSASWTRGPLTRCDVGPSSFDYDSLDSCMRLVPRPPMSLVVSGS